MSIAFAGSSDASDVCQVLASALPGTWSPEALVAELGRGEGAVLLAREGKLAVGLVVLRQVLDEAELMLVGVVPAMRRRGLGRALLAAAAGWARERGVVRLHLEVRASNAAAIALYRTFGFAQAGVRRRYYAEPVDDALLMTLSPVV